MVAVPAPAPSAVAIADRHTAAGIGRIARRSMVATITAASAATTFTVAAAIATTPTGSPPSGSLLWSNVRQLWPHVCRLCSASSGIWRRAPGRPVGIWTAGNKSNARSHGRDCLERRTERCWVGLRSRISAISAISLAVSTGSTSAPSIDVHHPPQLMSPSSRLRAGGLAPRGGGRACGLALRGRLLRSADTVHTAV